MSAEMTGAAPCGEAREATGLALAEAEAEAEKRGRTGAAAWLLGLNVPSLWHNIILVQPMRLALVCDSLQPGEQILLLSCLSCYHHHPRCSRIE